MLFAIVISDFCKILAFSLEVWAWQVGVCIKECGFLNMASFLEQGNKKQIHLLKMILIKILVTTYSYVSRPGQTIF